MKKLLVITQRTELLAVVKTKMSKKGYRVLGVKSSKLAKKAIKNGEVDFVLFDVETALEEGTLALNQTRTLNPEIPVVVTSLIAPLEDLN